MPGRYNFPQIIAGVTCIWLGAGGECRLMRYLAKMAEDREVGDKTADHDHHRGHQTERYCNAAYNLEQQQQCNGSNEPRRK